MNSKRRQGETDPRAAAGRDQHAGNIDAGEINVLSIYDGTNPLAAPGAAELGWHLQHAGFDELLRGEVSTRPADAALVALSGPATSTIEAVRTLHVQFPAAPIVVLTSDSGIAEQALVAGATAVLPAPARVTLLFAQLQAVLRQAQPSRTAADPAALLRVRGLRVDELRREVTANGRRIDLTPTEYRILHTLVRHAGRALSSDFLLQQSTGSDPGPPGAREIVKVHVARLRRKLREATDESDYIRNVRNVGYLLERRRRAARSEE